MHELVGARCGGILLASLPPPPLPCTAPSWGAPPPLRPRVPLMRALVKVLASLPARRRPASISLLPFPFSFARRCLLRPGPGLSCHFTFARAPHRTTRGHAPAGGGEKARHGRAGAPPRGRRGARAVSGSRGGQGECAPGRGRARTAGWRRRRRRLAEAAASLRDSAS